MPLAAFGCVIPLTEPAVGLPLAPLTVGLFGLIGRLGPVGIAGAPGPLMLDALGVPAEGVVPVPDGAVVAPGAA